jgi:glycosyltransferase involved in cell wall biosynthesis
MDIKNRLSICILSDHFLPLIGGGEFVPHYWAKFLTERGHAVVVPVLRPLRGKRENIPAFNYIVSTFPYLPFMPMMSRMIQFYLLHRRMKFDVVHANFLYPPGYVGRMIQRWFNVPCVATAQGADIHTYEGYGNLRDPKTLRRTLKVIRTLSGLVFTSQKIREQMIALGADSHRMHYVVNGTPGEAIVSNRRETLRRELGVEPTELLFVVISRNSPIKGLHLVLDAAATLTRQGKKFKVLIAGLKTETLRNEVVRRGIDHEVHVAGTIPLEIDKQTRIPKMPTQQVVDYLCASDVFLAPALSGGFELSTMDAMAAGLCIIISDNVGNQDLIRTGHNGMVVPNNRADYLADAMGQMIDRPEEARKMGKVNKELAREYYWDKIAERLETVYRKTINQWKENR